MDAFELAEAYALDPTPEGLSALRGAIMKDPGYDPLVLIGGTLNPLMREARYQDVVETVRSWMPGVLLSPSAHGYLAGALSALGETEGSRAESKFSRLSLDSIAATGSGSPDDPCSVLRQQKVLQEVVDQELRRYGHDGLTVHFDRNTGYSGYWTEFDRRRPFRGEHIVIDRAHALEASSLNTAAHEARHAAQDRWIEETNPSGFWFWRDEKEAEYAEIEENHGVTRADVDAFRENDKDYIEAPKAPPQEAPDEEWRQYQEDYDAYRYQPLEGDAWDEGDRFAEELTVEQLQQYQRDAGVPVTTP